MTRIRTAAALGLLTALGAGCSTPAAGPTGPAGSAPVPAALAQAPVVDGNFALFFGGTGRDDVDRVKIPVDPATPADTGATDMTIELWLRAEPGDNDAPAAECGAADAWIYGDIVLDRDRFGQGRKFGLSIADGVLVFGLTGDGADSESAPAVSTCGTTRVDDGRWHHVAVTRAVATGRIALYVDGRPDAEAAGPPGDVSYPDGAEPQASCDGGRPCTRSDPFLVLGAEKHDAGAEFPSFRGLLDELRLSTTLRYEGPFTPPSRRFEPDADTAALYHFDEGSGTVATDSSAGRTDGRVQVGGPAGAPAWVGSDAPTGP